MPGSTTAKAIMGILLLFTPTLAQTPAAPTQVPTAPGPGTLTATTKMETETVEIGDRMAFPSAITRSAGPFILDLINRTRFVKPALEWATPTPSATQVAAVSAAVNLKVLLTVRKQLSIVNLPHGVYLLQTSDGTVFLTLTIR